jgi:hypothetical protein
MEKHNLLNLNYTEEDGIFYVKDHAAKSVHRAIQLDKFKEMKFDIIIASMPQHIEPFQRLVKLHQPQAKFVFQIGNAWNAPAGVKNVLCSTKPRKTNTNTIFYHQEFDLGIFKYEPPTVHNVVNSYIHYMKKESFLHNVIADLPGWTGTAYGAGMTQSLHGSEEVANAMRDSSFTWHYKPGGDGFGHTIYSSYACGRPALIYKGHYKGCAAEELFIDGATCIDTSIRTGEEIVKALKYYSKPEEHARMCEQAHRRFRECVNFDQEAVAIKAWLENLQ